MDCWKWTVTEFLEFGKVSLAAVWKLTWKQIHAYIRLV